MCRTFERSRWKSWRPMLPRLVALGAMVAATAAAAPAANHTEPPVLPDKEAYRVVDLPGVPSDWGMAPMYAGYLPVETEAVGGNGTSPENHAPTLGGHLFFWLHESEASPSDPLVIWLNGGPGCSSLLGMLLENGPIKIPTVHDKMHSPGNPSPPAHRHFRTSASSPLPELIHNEYAWNRHNHVLYVEQPAETGFSYASKHAFPKAERGLSRDFYGFLRNFFQVFPEKRAAHLYIFGESYAGMYGPSIAREIHKQNGLPANVNATISLKGIALGNGWVDPHIQTKSYPMYAYHHSLIDAQGKAWLEQEMEACLKAIHIKRGGEQFARSGDLESCRILEKTLDIAGRPNEFDVSTFLTYDALLAPDAPLSVWLNDARVQEAIHVRGDSLPGVAAADVTDALPTGEGNRPWSVCNDAIDLPDDHPFSMLPTLKELLDAGLQVLLYNGENDLSCNFLGTEAYADALDWSGKQDWAKATRSIWRVRSGALGGGNGDGKRQLAATTSTDDEDAPAAAAGAASKSEEDGVVAGYYRTAGPLHFLVVLNSGHLLPMDQPERALDLVFRFTRGLSFADEPLPTPWTEEEKDPISEEVGEDGKKKPMEEEPGLVAQRLRRQGFVGFLLGFIMICVVVFFGSVFYRRLLGRWGHGAGYEGIGENGASAPDGGPWPQAVAGVGVRRDVSV